MSHLYPRAMNAIWMFTASGAPFFPLEPHPNDVRIEDIAHALSNLCRFAGHTREFYSVAQHCVLVSEICGPEPSTALWGLLHDASEAYLCDIVRPLKHAPELAGYRDIERAVQAAVCVRFGLPIEQPGIVKEVDLLVGRAEVRDLVRVPKGWHYTEAAHPTPIKALPPMTARRAFMKRFKELAAEMGRPA